MPAFKGWRAALLLSSVAASFSASCGLFEPAVAELWTDVPQMALYAVSFNNSQDRYRIHVDYEADLAVSLERKDRKPALAIGRYLKNSKTRPHFLALDQLFSELVINQSALYPDLLELGNAEGRQLLLPVSFNIPLVVFPKALDSSMRDGFVIDLSELEAKSIEVNKAVKGSFTNMGFGPRWYPDFLYALMRLYGADFREGGPLKWDKEALRAGLAAAREWTARVNGSAAKEEEFQFKYLYLPRYRSVEDGRIGYAMMNSSDFFVISEERRAALSFRWLAKADAVPVEDDIVYAGICREGSGRQAAEAFLKWFYSEGTQKAILDEARKYRSMESSFGIAGGFSAVKAVNEKLYPLFYPSLLGRMPEAEYLKAPNVLPAEWAKIKEEIILPYLLEMTGPNQPSDPDAVLEKRLFDWQEKRRND